MTGVVGSNRVTPPGDRRRRGAAVGPEVAPPFPHDLVRSICPYLGTGEGWRLAAPDRSHRCLAVSPAAPLALEKQARLCLVSAHEQCATNQAAREALGVRPTPDAAEGVRGESRTLRWSVPRTQATVLDVGRGSVDLRAVARQRTTAQVALVLLALVAFGSLILARIAAGSPGDRVAATATLPPASVPAVSSPLVVQSASPSASVAASTTVPTATPAPSPPPTPAATPSASAVPTASATPALATPEPSYRLYTVRAGDTISAIAGRFGVTARAIEAANGITDPTALQIGQVLRIPG